jgi:hypothetical protein
MVKTSEATSSTVPPLGMSKTTPLLDEKAPSSLTEKPTSTRRWWKCKITPRCVGCCAFKSLLILILVAGVCGLTYYITHKVDVDMYSKDKHPIQGCSNSTLIMQDWYYAQTNFAGSNFKYAVSFHPITHLVFADGSSSVYGTMYICDEATGEFSMPAVNCTNTFVLDYRTCTLAFSLSECMEEQENELNVEWIAYDSSLADIQIYLTSPNGSMTLDLTHTSSNHSLDCSNLDPF